MSRVIGVPRWPGAGLSLPGREVNAATPTPVGAWSPLNNAIITDIEDGIRVAYDDTANPLANQTALINGVRYLVYVEVRSDGAIGQPRVKSGNSSLVLTGDVSGDWHIVTGEGLTTNTRLDLQSLGAGGWCEFRNLKVWSIPTTYATQLGDALYLDSIQLAQVSAANEDSGQLSNTGYLIQSGAWRVKGNGVEQWIECIAAGIIYRRDTSAYGTWEFDFHKAHPSDTFIRFVSDSLAPDSFPTTPDSGYSLRMLVSEIISLRRTGNAYLLYTAADYIDGDARYRHRVTRSAANVFYYYIKGGAFADWTLVDPSGGGGVNPVTQASVTTSLYCTLDLDAGDRLYLDQHRAGVIAP